MSTKQTAAIVIFPVGISPEVAERYLKLVLPTLTAPGVPAPISLGDVNTFIPDYGTPVIYQP